MGKRIDLRRRFEAKVARRGADECWEWTANKNNQGYGLIREGGLLPKRLAHRVSYELHCGHIPHDLCVLHRCDNPACVNPAHLFLGTLKENTHDMIAKGRKRTVLNPNNRPPTFRGSSHPKAVMNEAKVLEARKRYAAGWSLAQLMQAYGIKKRGLQHILRGEFWRHVGGPLSVPMQNSHEIFRGSNSKNAKLTEQTARIARERCAAGETQQAVADSLGVSRGTIYDCVSRKTWKHLP
jgi:hypothetical protein